MSFNPIAALAGIATNIVSQVGNSLVQHASTRSNMKKQHELNEDEMAYSQQLQRSQQEWLMNNLYGKTVSGMKNAGLNPATANGVSPAVPSGGSTSTGPSGPAAGMPNFDLSGGALTSMQIDSMKADIESKEIDNARKKLLLKDEANASEFGYREEGFYRDPFTGDSIDDVTQWKKDHPGLLPEFGTIIHNRGHEQQRQQENEWKTKDFERNARAASAKLEIAIKSGQLKDEKVMKAFVELPANERKTLTKLWREYDDNHDLSQFQKEAADLQNKDFKATSFGSLVDNLKGDLGFGEKLFAFLGWVFNRATQNTNFSFGFRKK